jgi:hypothetical protein
MDKVKTEGGDAATKVDKDSGIDAKKRGRFNFGNNTRHPGHQPQRNSKANATNEKEMCMTARI